LKQVSCGETMQSVLKNADALVIVTEWKAFRSPDFEQLKQELKDAIIFDGRNLYEPEEMKLTGFEYHEIGQKTCE
jgi:UDPglucose 6-dehydrogenase